MALKRTGRPIQREIWSRVNLRGEVHPYPPIVSAVISNVQQSVAQVRRDGDRPGHWSVDVVETLLRVIEGRAIPADLARRLKADR